MKRQTVQSSSTDEKFRSDCAEVSAQLGKTEAEKYSQLEREQSPSAKQERVFVAAKRELESRTR